FYANIYGSKLLNNILGSNQFDFPKSVFTIRECLFAVSAFRKPEAMCLDYFAGSGTTGHATISLNREHGGSRKYILVEMGEYFDTVLKQRLLKIVFSEDWKNGAPVPQTNPKDPTNPYAGVSHCLKV